MEQWVRVVRVARVITLASWAVAACFAAWAAVRMLGVQWGTPVIQLIAYTPQVTAAAAVTAVVFLLMKRRIAAVATLVAAVALGSTVVPRMFGDADDEPRGPTLRVLTLNLRVGAVPAKDVVALVRKVHPDLVAFQEYTPPGALALEAAGIAKLLPYKSAHARGFALGSAIYSTRPLSRAGVRKHDSGFWQAHGVVTLDGAARALAVESAHPCAPIGPSRDDCWAEDLADQPRPNSRSGPLQLLLGDFNSTVDHVPFRRLLDTGYRDAADVVGEGLTWTWPATKWIPGVVLDHVLVGPGVGVRKVEVHDVPGSDHRAVFAEIVLPAR